VRACVRVSVRSGPVNNSYKTVEATDFKFDTSKFDVHVSRDSPDMASWNFSKSHVTLIFWALNANSSKTVKAVRTSNLTCMFPGTVGGDIHSHQRLLVLNSTRNCNGTLKPTAIVDEKRSGLMCMDDAVSQRCQGCAFPWWALFGVVLSSSYWPQSWPNEPKWGPKIWVWTGYPSRWPQYIDVEWQRSVVAVPAYRLQGVRYTLGHGRLLCQTSSAKQHDK